MPRELFECGSYNGEVNTGMVEDSAGNTTVSFPAPFRVQPQVQAIVVLVRSADGLQEGAVIKAVPTVKGSGNEWTGFELAVSKHSGGSITDTTRVHVTWMAMADQ